MKKSLLLLNLISMILIAFPQVSFAKKKYRYIKREHGVRVSLDWPKSEIVPEMKLMDKLNFQFTYTYNWKGFVEVGPYLTVAKDDSASWMVDAGLLVEWNIIKNRGKRTLVPAIGLKIGSDNATASGRFGHYGIPCSLKYFVAKRTPLIITVEPYIEAPGFTGFDPFTVKLNTTVGFEYYFDFY